MIIAREYEDLRPSRAEAERDAREGTPLRPLRPETQKNFDAFLDELLSVECQGCGLAFDSACDVCHPF